MNELEYTIKYPNPEKVTILTKNGKITKILDEFNNEVMRVLRVQIDQKGIEDPIAFLYRHYFKYDDKGLYNPKTYIQQCPIEAFKEIE